MQRSHPYGVVVVEDELLDGALLSSDVETALNMPDRDVPSACIAKMAATETSAAIRPYSMAVAPLWFLRRLRINLNIFFTPAICVVREFNLYSPSKKSVKETVT